MTNTRSVALCGGALAAVVFAASSVQAQTAPSVPTNAPPQAVTQQAAATQPGLWDRPALTGDWGGARTRLEDRGVTFTLTGML